MRAPSCGVAVRHDRREAIDRVDVRVDLGRRRNARIFQSLILAISEASRLVLRRSRVELVLLEGSGIDHSDQRGGGTGGEGRSTS